MNFFNRIPTTMKTPRHLPKSEVRSQKSGVRSLTPRSWLLSSACCLLSSIFCLLSLPAAHAAGPPEAMTYQGFLVDANGNPLAPSTPANYPVIFRIFQAASGGASLWSEQQIVTVDKGNFSVILSEGSAVGAEPKPLLSIVLSTNGADRYIQISVTIGTTTSDMLPRLRLLPSPYAFLATSANNLVSPAGVPVIRYGNSRVEVTGDIAASGVISGNGAGLTGLTVGQVSGTFADSQLSANVARRDVGNAFNGQQSINGTLGVGTVFGTFPLTIGNQTLGDKISLYGQSGNSYGFGVQGGLFQIHTDTAGSDVAFGHGSSAAMTETMRIKGNGNVGIGTTAPQDKLQIGDFGTSSGYLSLKTGGGNLWQAGIKFRHFNDTIGFDLVDSEATPNGLNFIRYPAAAGVSAMFIDRFSGNVGIATTAPTAKLEVNGAIKATSIAVNGTISATTFNGNFNGEEPPRSWTTGTGNLDQYRDFVIDGTTLLGDEDGGRIKMVVRNHGDKTVRIWVWDFYSDVGNLTGRSDADGTVVSFRLDGTESNTLVGQNPPVQRDLYCVPGWMCMRTYRHSVLNGGANGPAFGPAEKYKFYVMFDRNISATVYLYDR